MQTACAMTTSTATTSTASNRPRSSTPEVHYKTLRIGDLDIFYREAGREDAPVLLLLHGFPTSSNMYRNLIPRLASSFRVIAPDYPGYGQSSMPPREKFTYTFEHLADIVEQLVQKLKIEKLSLYVMDYGAPVGYRLALRHPDQIEGLIVQNANAYAEGLLGFWDPIKKYWNDPKKENRDALRGLVAPDATRWQYQNGVKDASLLDPTAWAVDQAGLDRPGNAEIQLDLLYDYRTNLPLYPRIPGVLSSLQAADADRVGKERRDIPRRRRGALSARPARRRDPSARHGALRARNPRGRDRRSRRGFPSSKATARVVGRAVRGAVRKREAATGDSTRRAYRPTTERTMFPSGSQRPRKFAERQEEGERDVSSGRGRPPESAGKVGG
jgi:pimeloyl-ACP methyl ester carboxylesterase